MKDPRTIARCGLIIALALVSGSQFVLTQVSAQTVTPRWSLTGNLNAPRHGHTATLLTNGKVLVAGGASSCGSRMSSAELYDPSTGTWSVTGSLHIARGCHAATLLPNGKVLIAGNCESSSSTELYDPVSGTWQPTGSFNKIRGSITATLLPNGRVLAVGGSGVGLVAEVYDPITGTWSITGTPSISGFTVLLPDGKVLNVWEGLAWDNYDDGLFTQLYDPATELWTDTGFVHHMHFANTVTVLQTGKALIMGDRHAHAQLYDNISGTWSVTGVPNTGRVYHTSTLQVDGRVLVAGGISSGPVSQAELYDSTTGTWSFTASLISPRFLHTATLLRNGKTLVVGGINVGQISNCAALQSAELYDPGDTSTPNPIDDPQFFVRQHYLDFLNREPEPGGLNAWLSVLNNCHPGDSQCLHEARLTTSAGFFGSQEFQLKGYFIYRVYKLAFNRLPEFAEIAPDMQIVTGQTAAEVYARKSAFTNAFIKRQEFASLYAGLSNADFVATLLSRYGLESIDTPDPINPDGTLKLTLTRGDLINGLDATALTRAQVLRAIADSDQVFHLEFNRAFVAMQYYGYLRRTPEPAGYQSWLNYLNANPSDFREMIRGFVDSVEYRHRFDGCAAACCGCWNY